MNVNPNFNFKIMKNKGLLMGAALGLSLSLSAQELPLPSPLSTLEQRVGLTDITIQYSRPSVKDREIFGGLVTYGELWRTGANAATTIEFSTMVTFGQEEIEPGKYALLTIPDEDLWTVILNRDTTLRGTGNYDEAKDVLRVNLAPRRREERLESLTFDINDLRDNSATIVLGWEYLRLYIPLEIQTEETALRNIQEALDEAPQDEKWRVHRNAASYNLNNQNYSEAMEHINASLAMKRDNWYSYYLKARIFAATEEYGEAVDVAAMALKIGRDQAESAGQEFQYSEMIERDIEDWAEM